jgi:ribose transport system substrate-binding protein
MKLTRLAAAFAMLLLALVVVAGCGSSGDSGGSTSGGSETSGETESTSGGSEETASDTGGEYPSEDFWAGFKEIPAVAPENEKVDTSEYKLPESQKLKIGYADSSQSNSWRVMAKGTTEEAIANVGGGGAEMVYTNANDSATQQISDMNDLITQGVDAIIISAVDVSGVCPSIDKALEAGIPVIVQERSVECDKFTSFIDLDATNVAENEMEFIATRLGGKGKIAIISGVPGAGHTVLSDKGYANILANYPEIEVTNEEYAKYDPSLAKQDAATILTANPDIEAFASIDGEMTTGIVEAAEQAGKLDQMKAWTGNDQNGWMLTAVENDLPNLTVPYSPTAGAVAVETAVKILRGEEVMKTEIVHGSESPVEFSENLAELADPNKPEEWWYSEISCEFDPFCNS